MLHQDIRVMCMSCEWLELLNAAGVDTKGSLQRFMNNETLYKKFVIKFLNDENFKLLQDAVNQENAEMILTSSHTLKGVCGNLGFVVLYDISAAIVNAIRADQLKEAILLYRDFEKAYEQLYDVIQTVARCS